MKKSILATTILLFWCTLIFSVGNVFAALSQVDNSNTSWKADADDIIYIWDSGSDDVGQDISEGEIFGLFSGEDPLSGNTLVLLNDKIDAGMLEFSNNGQSVTYKLLDGTVVGSLSPLNDGGDFPEWGFYFQTTQGETFFSYTPDFFSPTVYDVVELEETNTFNFKQDGVEASASTTPIPVPTAGLLLFSGLIGIVGLRSRFA